MTIEWGEIRLHNGGTECPAEAMDVPCMILEESRWLGATGARRGSGWKWRTVTAYRLPADVPAADPVRHAPGHGLRKGPDRAGQGRDEMTITSPLLGPQNPEEQEVFAQEAEKFEREIADAIIALRKQIAEAEARYALAKGKMK